MAKRIRNAYKTTRDGFIVLAYEDGTVHAFEGEALCTKNAKDYLKTHDPIRISEFYQDAISYGLIV